MLSPLSSKFFCPGRAAIRVPSSHRDDECSLHAALTAAVLNSSIRVRHTYKKPTLVGFSWGTCKRLQEIFEAAGTQGRLGRG
jgi:hypothetical protein